MGETSRGGAKFVEFYNTRLFYIYMIGEGRLVKMKVMSKLTSMSTSSSLVETDEMRRVKIFRMLEKSMDPP